MSGFLNRLGRDIFSPETKESCQKSRWVKKSLNWNVAECFSHQVIVTFLLDSETGVTFLTDRPEMSPKSIFRWNCRNIFFSRNLHLHLQTRFLREKKNGEIFLRSFQIPAKRAYRAQLNSPLLILNYACQSFQSWFRFYRSFVRSLLLRNKVFRLMAWHFIRQIFEIPPLVGFSLNLHKHENSEPYRGNGLRRRRRRRRQRW